MILRDLRYPRGHQVWEIEGGQEARVPQEGAQVPERSGRRRGYGAGTRRVGVWARSWHRGLQVGKRELWVF